MPYKLQKKGNKWMVAKKDGTPVAGHKTPLTREQAMKAMKARYANEKGKNA